jgi:coenzyme F420-0:L-glutamate ligase/coenzyme F420-1:gamma-L-glutamate ligase
MAAATPAHPPASDDVELVPGDHLEREALRRVIRERRSIRRYEDRSVARSVIEDLLTCASWAPSAHNRQPWRFCVVTDRSEQERLADAMGDRWAADLRTDGVDEATVKRRVDISRTRMTTAAALIVACLCMDDMDVYEDEKRQAAERTMAVQSVALACQNLLLSAHANGLGACWMCAPLFVPELVGNALDLPASWEPQALITLGYPAVERESKRKPLDSRVVWRE